MVADPNVVSGLVNPVRCDGALVWLWATGR